MNRITKPTPDESTRLSIEASCRVADDPDIFFPEGGRSAKKAKRICRECPVAEICLRDAMLREEDKRFGIYGGLTPSERDALGELMAKRLIDLESVIERHTRSTAGRR